MFGLSALDVPLSWLKKFPTGAAATNRDLVATIVQIRVVFLFFHLWSKSVFGGQVVATRAGCLVHLEDDFIHGFCLCEL